MTQAALIAARRHIVRAHCASTPAERRRWCELAAEVLFRATAADYLQPSQVPGNVKAGEW
jgi:hypothetical protein